MRVLRGVANVIALAITGGLGVTLIVGGAGGLSFSSLTPTLDRLPGSAFVIVVGVLLLLVAVFFLVASADARISGAVFAREGVGGRIALTSYAIREFISGILRDEVGLDRFRVILGHRNDGVVITVRLSLTHDQRVTDVGERVQTVLAREIPERTGVDVSEVSILVRGIRPLGRSQSSEEG